MGSSSSREPRSIKKELKQAIEDDDDLSKVKSIIAERPEMLRFVESGGQIYLCHLSICDK